MRLGGALQGRDAGRATDVISGGARAGCWASDGCEQQQPAATPTPAGGVAPPLKRGARGTAVSCTGTGEEIMRRLLASRIAEAVADPESEATERIRGVMGAREGEAKEWVDPLDSSRTAQIRRWLGALTLVVHWDDAPSSSSSSSSSSDDVIETAAGVVCADW
ncbi:hypothetical protein T484DRAFT_1899944 [Baffinella frigidus]|nr:hypothetical protein T484DRAFT_1899944 [Cryptophyta sp. CCMP2293]